MMRKTYGSTMLALVCGPWLVLACGDDGSTAPATTTAGDGGQSSGDGSTAAPSDTSSAMTSSSDGGDGTTGTTTTTTADTASSEGTSAHSDTSSDSGEAAMCPTGMLSTRLPADVSGDTSLAPSSFASACGGQGAPDASFLFTAPRDGSYAFDTILGCPLSREFDVTHGLPICPMDTIITVLDGECDGEELRCSDDDFGTASVVGVDLTAGQTVTVVVDGVGSMGGPFTLRASELAVACPVAELGPMLPVTVPSQNAIAENGHDASCFGSNGGRPDAMFSFTAPHAGTFAFDTPGTDFDTLVFVLDGTCEGEEIACGLDLPLAVDLAAGQAVTVGVEGGSADDVGDLNLRVQEL